VSGTSRANMTDYYYY